MDRCFKHLEIAKARLAEMKSRLYLSRRLSTTERAMELGLLQNPKTIKKGTARPYPKSITLSQQGIGGKKREAYLWSALIDKNTAK